MLCSACRSYESAPLDLETHRAAWHGVRLDSDETRARLAALEVRSFDREADYDPTDGLGLAEAELVARASNAELRVAREHVLGRERVARATGAWPDPTLEFGAHAIDSQANDPWLFQGALVFELPLGDARDAARSVARLEHALALADLLAHEWRLWCRVQREWIDWSIALERAGEHGRQLEALHRLVEGAASLARAGELAPSEAGLFEVEEAACRVRAQEARSALREAESRLRTALGLAPDVDVTLVPSLALLVEPPPAAAVEALLEARNPELLRKRLEHELTEERLRAEIARQWPSLGLGPAFESEEGVRRFGLVGGLPLPLFDRNRRGIAEAEAERGLARARFEATYEELAMRARRLERRVADLAERVATLETDLLPLVEQQLTRVQRLLELGEIDALVLLESTTQAHEARLEWLAARRDSSRARIEWIELLGPPADEGASGAFPSEGTEQAAAEAAEPKFEAVPSGDANDDEAGESNETGDGSR